MAKLETLKRSLRRKGFRWEITPSDEAALLEGCVYDRKRAEHVCEFFPTFLRHGKGEHWLRPFELLPWQEELLSRQWLDQTQRHPPVSVGLRRSGEAFREVSIGSRTGVVFLGDGWREGV